MTRERRVPLYPKVLIDGHWRYPAEARAEARRLRSQGLSLSEIARKLGIPTITTLKRWFDPKLAERELAASRRRLKQWRRTRGPVHRRFTPTPEDGVQCRECGHWYYTLGPHLKVHGLIGKTYREKHGHDLPLTGEAMRQSGRDRWQDGQFSPSPRRLTCKRGHRFTPANTIITSRGRTCRKCHLARQRERYASEPDHREKILRQGKESFERRLSDPESRRRFLEWRHKYRDENRDRERALARKRYRERVKSDPDFVERRRQNGRLVRARQRAKPDWPERARQRRERARERERERYAKDLKYRARYLAKQRANRARKKAEREAQTKRRKT